MFWFRHPRPPDRRAVATLVVARKGEAATDTGNIVIGERTSENGTGGVLPGQSEADTIAPIEFAVRYRLREYLDLMHEHIAFMLRKKRHARSGRFQLAPGLLASLCLAVLAGGACAMKLAPPLDLALAAFCSIAAIAAFNAPIMLRPWLLLIVPPMFLYKRSRMPLCEFSIDEERIVRRAGNATLTLRWSDVHSVRRYAIGYLVLSRRGGMPLPLRCLDAQQRARLRAIVANHQMSE